MGTNFYRIPTHEEVEHRRATLIKQISEMEITPFNIERGFAQSQDDSWDDYSPWDKFMENMSIHLGKRSQGWRFCWNFHDNKYYSNKAELLKFIMSGRVVDEYGEDQPADEFIEMAMNWCPDGLIGNDEYHRKNSTPYFSESHLDREIDGLRVSSATDFC
jgi:hypothetical protein